jgi:Protein of unknown function (DUF2851)
MEAFMNTPHIPEWFFRQIWQQQRFSSGELHTPDGRKVEILSPGTPNMDEGPDFTDARVRIGNITFFGDVELHLDAVDWDVHSHQHDPHYNRVILHVVLTADPLLPPARTASKRSLPLLVLHPYLDDPLRAVWMGAVSDDRNERLKTIPCYNLNDSIPAELAERWLTQLGHQRMEMKIRRFEERLKELIDEGRLFIREPFPRYYGNPDEIPPPAKEYTRKDFANKSHWEQLLYESVMEGLGYAKNAKPFLNLARSMRLRTLRQHNLRDLSTTMALLFGAAGLLPAVRSIPEKEAREYVRRLKKRWKELRPSLRGRVLHSGDWLFFRLRPSNFPTSRLASMCFVLPTLFDDEGFRTMVSIFKQRSVPSKTRIDRIRSIFTFEPDPFWLSRYRFDSCPTGKRLSIGKERIDDLIVNCILPIMLLYARIFRDATIRAHAHQVFGAMPSPEENSVTRSLQTQLLKKKLKFKSALLHQGGIQLHRMFCTPSRCSECAIGVRLHM